MRIIFYVATVGIAAVVTFGFSLLIWRVGMRYRLYPKIRERDVHTRPTPRLGGVAMFIGLLVAFLVASRIPGLSLVFSDPGEIVGILAAALLIVIIGVADDLWDLGWISKLAGQVIAAGILAWQGVQISFLPLPGVLLLNSSIVSLAITVFLVVLVMNAVNFVDGLDGLVAGLAIISNGVFFVYTYLISSGTAAVTEYFNLGSFIAAVVIGICLGFLPLNWHPARLFMGDSGALLVGMLMAVSTIAVTGSVDPCNITRCTDATQTSATILGGSGLLPAFIPILLPFAVLIVPLLDFVLAVLRRVAAGKSPFSADRKHLHHRLLDMGHSHLQAVLIFYVWTAVASVGCLLFLVVNWWWALIALVLGFLVCAIITLAPLTARKVAEVVVQSTDAEVVADAGIDILDPLDAASDVVPLGGEPDAAALTAVRVRTGSGRRPVSGDIDDNEESLP